MKNILIIGCGLLGSSLVRKIKQKKISKQIFVYEKSKKYLSQIKKLKLPCKIVKSTSEVIDLCDLIIFCTPMSEYQNIIKKINPKLNSKNIVTDIGSSKIESQKIINKYLTKKQIGYPVTQLQDQR